MNLPKVQILLACILCVCYGKYSSEHVEIPVLLVMFQLAVAEI